MGTYEASVHGYGSAYFWGETAGQARAEAWRAFQCACECSFKEFLKKSYIAKVELPPRMGYAYVRRVYGVDAQAGMKATLRNEGTWDGTIGEIVYPGESTAHVHVKVEDVKHPLIVHPDNVVLHPTPTNSEG